MSTRPRRHDFHDYIRFTTLGGSTMLLVRSINGNTNILAARGREYGSTQRTKNEYLSFSSQHTFSLFGLRYQADSEIHRERTTFSMLCVMEVVGHQ